MRGFAVVGLLGVVACAAPSSKDDAVASDAAELKSSTVQDLGTIEDGDTKSVSYSSPPKYRSYSFEAKGGDSITIDVKSTNGGDAMVWLTNATYSSTYAANDDADSSTLDSHVEYTVPSGTAKKSYRIVFRDYDQLAASFKVKLQIDSAGGSTDPDPDTCDPSNEPWRIYKGTPATCQVIRYTCPSSMSPFFNDCGCGCE